MSTRKSCATLQSVSYIRPIASLSLDTRADGDYLRDMMLRTRSLIVLIAALAISRSEHLNQVFANAVNAQLNNNCPQTVAKHIGDCLIQHKLTADRRPHCCQVREMDMITVAS